LKSLKKNQTDTRNEKAGDEKGAPELINNFLLEVDMPRGDGTGPFGKGPQGWGQGPCGQGLKQGQGVPGAGRGRGRDQGLGQGIGRGIGRGIGIGRNTSRTPGPALDEDQNKE
jgi:hypothetical protein